MQPAKEEKGLFRVYLWTLTYLKPYGLPLAGLLLAMGASSAAELAAPRWIQHFIDVVVPSGQKQLFIGMLGLLALIFAMKLLAAMGSNVLQRKVQEYAARDLQTSIFRHLRRLGFSYFERHPVGETLSFLNTEVAAVQGLYRQGFPAMLNGFVFSAVAVVLLVTTSAKLSLIVAPSFLLYYVVGPRLERAASLAGKELSSRRIEENRKVYESVSALTELRASGAEQWDMERYARTVKARNDTYIRMLWYAYWRGTNRRLTYNLGGLFIFIYGFHLVGQGSLTVGEFVAFLLVYFTAMHRITGVVTLITEQRVLMYQAIRLYEFMQLKPDVEEAEQPLEAAEVNGELRFEGVSFAYEGGRPVLQDFNLEVPAGMKVALVGTSGNGKSTVLKLAGRFYDPDEGSIKLDGVPIDKLSFDSLRSSFGYVFQETYLFGASVMDNIRFGLPEATDEQVVAAAKAAYAHNFIMELPDGYDTLVGERGVRLSGGQKQRIAIARMFVKQPSVILLDEATSALDNISETEVQKSLEQLLEGRTILAVAHRLTTVKDFDRIVVIHEGRVAESGGYEELIRQQGHLYRLVQGYAVEVGEADKRAKETARHA
jgi:ATP-binding cassette subfamily B protein